MTGGIGARPIRLDNKEREPDIPPNVGFSCICYALILAMVPGCGDGVAPEDERAAPPR